MGERCVQSFKKSMKKITNGALDERLSNILFTYHTTPQSTTGQTPAELTKFTIVLLLILTLVEILLTLLTGMSNQTQIHLENSSVPQSCYPSRICIPPDRYGTYVCY